MKAKCPDCGKINKVVTVPGGFIFNQAEYKCSCGYIIITLALNFEQAKRDIKKYIRKDVMLALGTEAVK